MIRLRDDSVGGCCCNASIKKFKFEDAMEARAWLSNLHCDDPRIDGKRYLI